MSQNQNFALFPNMGLETLSQFLFESSEKIFERPKKISLDRNLFRIFLYFHYCDSKLNVGSFINISACRAEATLHNVLVDVLFVI